ncbi:unnamed protein product [Darwinula stevensoni]|uniref:Uncharacterized protein n=1 Tax=Darwinula stevensoni TaxID=69355 RepID=A0A7R9A3V2_9CRUS|nr:unnamed protein product [Darwinula stevensoni]CAG0891330.1 unnamed protein product [Darwinula stevensoni]
MNKHPCDPRTSHPVLSHPDGIPPFSPSGITLLRREENGTPSVVRGFSRVKALKEKLCENDNFHWIHDLCYLHRGHADGYFWIFNQKDELPGHIYEELKCSFRIEVVTATNDSESVQESTNESESVLESTWLYQAQEHIKSIYRDWESPQTTRLVPPVEDINGWINAAKSAGEESERTLLRHLCEMGKINKMPMFITYNRNFVHLIERRNKGGGLEGILVCGEHDIVLIHRHIGIIFIQVKNLDTEQTGNKLTKALERNIQTAEEQLEKDLRSLEAATRECGLTGMNVSLRIIALTNAKRDQVAGTSHGANTVFLCAEDNESAETMERWWHQHILQSQLAEIPPIDSRTYLQLVAIYIGPIYATPAYTARLTIERLNFLTADKLDMLVNGAKDFVFKGAAGTGKTWLLQEKIRNIFMSWFSNGPITDKDEKILLVCRNNLLTSHLRKTIPDLLLTSAAPVPRRHIEKEKEKDEMQMVRQILRNNLFICSLEPYEQELGVGVLKGKKANDELTDGECKENEYNDLQNKGLVSKVRNATWEIVILFEILGRSVAVMSPGNRGRWPLKASVIGRLFQSFSPSVEALKFLASSIEVMAFKKAIAFQLYLERYVGPSMLGITMRLSACSAVIAEMPAEMQHDLLVDMESILKTRKPAFLHIFVDEAEDLCHAFSDQWLTSLRHLHKECGGYFWRAYDPLSLPELPVTLRKEVGIARSLLRVMRNPRSVLDTWTGDEDSLGRDEDLTRSSLSDPTYKREYIISGHDVRGPKVLTFDVPSSILSEEIQRILLDKFGNWTYVRDVAILFADPADFFIHGERLRKEMEEKIRDSSGPIFIHRVDSFKGMEAAIVFLITNEKAKRGSRFYMGASRSTSYLFQISLEPTVEEDAAAETSLMEGVLKALPDDAPAEEKNAWESKCRRVLLMKNL